MLDDIYDYILKVLDYFYFKFFIRKIDYFIMLTNDIISHYSPEDLTNMTNIMELSKILDKINEGLE